MTKREACRELRKPTGYLRLSRVISFPPRVSRIEVPQLYLNGALRLQHRVDHIWDVLGRVRRAR